MDAQQQANVFRMLATLFANNNYQISQFNCTGR